MDELTDPGRCLISVHSHILLLGWATLATTGIVYLVLPRCAGTRLAAAHFWLHNLGLPVMIVSLAAAALGEPRAEPLIGVGSILGAGVAIGSAEVVGAQPTALISTIRRISQLRIESPPESINIIHKPVYRAQSDAPRALPATDWPVPT